MKISRPDRNRAFAVLTNGQHLLHREFRRPLLVGELGLEFERDVAAEPERPGLVVGPLKTALSRRPSRSSRPRAVVSIDVGALISIVVMNQSPASMQIVAADIVAERVPAMQIVCRFVSATSLSDDRRPALRPADCATCGEPDGFELDVADADRTRATKPPCRKPDTRRKGNSAWIRRIQSPMISAGWRLA